MSTKYAFTFTINIIREKHSFWMKSRIALHYFLNGTKNFNKSKNSMIFKVIYYNFWKKYVCPKSDNFHVREDYVVSKLHFKKMVYISFIRPVVATTKKSIPIFCIKI